MLSNNVEVGRIYINKTWKYLFPATKSYGELFITRMDNVFKMAVGINDNYYPKAVGKAIFLVVDKLFMPNRYEHTMKWLRYQDYYIDDYPFDDIERGRMQMIVLRFPDKYAKAYELFMKGKYSQMYTDEEVDRYFRENDNTREDVVNILRKKPGAAERFLVKLKNSFGDDINVTKQDLMDAELDFPPQLQFEIFNYKTQ